MEMNGSPIKEVFDELFSLLEVLETRSAAMVQFLTDQGIATDEKFGPYLERAGAASNVKWRAARLRMEYLLLPIEKASQDSKNQNPKDQSDEQNKGENKEQNKGENNEGTQDVRKSGVDESSKDDGGAAKTETAGTEMEGESKPDNAKAKDTVR